ncbi:hypothetical protein PS673_05750 [Pseudomonas fluorescens]|uniref:Uncharacterized protein n=1 Tax=Pseudomonas fluorescens TaxID=294 RepID=A0A5E6Y1N4_PSEFL|nr:hypothetical protein PS673_05750 [Pseudomonas fluorescens]
MVEVDAVGPTQFDRAAIPIAEIFRIKAAGKTVIAIGKVDVAAHLVDVAGTVLIEHRGKVVEDVGRVRSLQMVEHGDPATHLADTEFLPYLNNGIPEFLAVLARGMNLETDFATHALAQNSHLDAGHHRVFVAHELHVAQTFAGHFLKQPQRGRPLNVVADYIEKFHFNVVGTIVSTPVIGPECAVGDELLFPDTGQNPLFNHLTVFIGMDDVFGVSDLEVVHRIDSAVRKQLEHIWPRVAQCRNRLRPVTDIAGFFPGAFFIDPIGMLRRTKDVAMGGFEWTTELRWSSWEFESHVTLPFSSWGRNLINLSNSAT